MSVPLRALTVRTVGFYTKVSIIRYMNMCGYMHVYKEVRSVSTREGEVTDKCEFAHNGFVYKSIYDLKNEYL